MTSPLAVAGFDSTESFVLVSLTLTLGSDVNNTCLTATIAIEGPSTLSTDGLLLPMHLTSLLDTGNELGDTLSVSDIDW